MKMDMAGLPSVLTPFQRASTPTARARSGCVAGSVSGLCAASNVWYALTRNGMK